MSSIAEDNLNKVINFTNGVPSDECLQEYVKWKKTDRADLLKKIEGLSYSGRRDFLFQFYATTVEFTETREITDHLDAEITMAVAVYSEELQYLLKRGEKSKGDDCAYLMCRYDDLNENHGRRMAEIRDFVRMSFFSRLPIFNDIQWMVTTPDVVKTILDRIPK